MSFDKNGLLTVARSQPSHQHGCSLFHGTSHIRFSQLSNVEHRVLHHHSVHEYPHDLSDHIPDPLGWRTSQCADVPKPSRDPHRVCIPLLRDVHRLPRALCRELLCIALELYELVCARTA